MASVTGSRSTKLVPFPGSVRTSSVPPSARRRVIATSIPTPRPDTLVTASAVVNPGRASTRSSWSSDRASACASTKPSRCARASALAHRGQHDLAFGLLPRLAPLGRRLDAVIYGIPKQMHERIAQLVQDRAVQLDLLPLHPQRDLL